MIPTTDDSYPTGIWNRTGDAVTVAGGIELVPAGVALKDGAVWSNTMVEAAETEINFKAIVEVGAGAHGFAAFLVPATSKLVSYTSGEDDSKFGVKWGDFTGLAVFVYEDSFYTYTSPGTSLATGPPLCYDPGVYTKVPCGSINFRGKTVSVSVIYTAKKRLRVTVCMDGDYCYIVRDAREEYDFALGSQPYYIGVGGTTGDNVNEYPGSVVSTLTEIQSKYNGAWPVCNGNGFNTSGSCVCFTGWKDGNCQTGKNFHTNHCYF